MCFSHTYVLPHECGKTFFRFYFMIFMCLVIFLTCLKHIFIINVVRAIIRVGKAISQKNIETIYESSCFKMDTIFSLEFDRKKYYEDLKEKAQQEQTNNTND